MAAVAAVAAAMGGGTPPPVAGEVGQMEKGGSFFCVYVVWRILAVATNSDGNRVGSRVRIRLLFIYLFIYFSPMLTNLGGVI